MIYKSEDIRHWLALSSIPNIGIVGLLETASLLNTPLSSISSMHREQLLDLGWSSEQIACLSEPHPFTEVCERWLNADANKYIITFECDAYPEQLKAISQAPLILFAHGDHTLLKAPQLAVVGSRHPSASGLKSTQKIVEQVTSRSSLAITSGLALGIDAQSHKVALASGASSIAVLGNGIDVVYPKRHRSLYQEMIEKGLLVSEFPPSVLPNPKLFPRRNRIISGLSLGTLVAEARIKSGSLVSAKYAMEQGREVFAIPGNIENPLAKGCHFLLKQGAKLVEDAQDIFDELNIQEPKLEQKQGTKKNAKQCLASLPMLDSVESASTSDASNTSSIDKAISSEVCAHNQVLAAIDFDVTPIDVIAKRSGKAIPILLTELLEYELRGLVASTSEGYLKLRA